MGVQDFTADCSLTAVWCDGVDRFADLTPSGSWRTNVFDSMFEADDHRGSLYKASSGGSSGPMHSRPLGRRGTSSGAVARTSLLVVASSAVRSYCRCSCCRPFGAPAACVVGAAGLELPKDEWAEQARRGHTSRGIDSFEQS